MMFDRRSKGPSVIVCVRDKFYNDFMARLIYKLNVTTGKDELVPENWTLQFNMVTGKHEFAPPKADHTYNQVTGKTELRNRDRNDQHVTNVPEGTIDLGAPDWTQDYDIVNGKFVTRPPKKKPWE